MSKCKACGAVASDSSEPETNLTREEIGEELCKIFDNDDDRVFNRSLDQRREKFRDQLKKSGFDLFEIPVAKIQEIYLIVEKEVAEVTLKKLIQSSETLRDRCPDDTVQYFAKIQVDAIAQAFAQDMRFADMVNHLQMRKFFDRLTLFKKYVAEDDQDDQDDRDDGYGKKIWREYGEIPYTIDRESEGRFIERLVFYIFERCGSDLYYFNTWTDWMRMREKQLSNLDSD